MIRRAEFPSELRYQEPGRLEAAGGGCGQHRLDERVLVLGQRNQVQIGEPARPGGQRDIPRGVEAVRRLSIRDSAGAEVAVISRPGLLTRYEILVGSQLATVRPRGFLGQRFEIDSAAGRLEARGNFSGRQYSVTRGGVQAAAVTQLRTLRERFAVEITDGEDPVLMLAVVLVIEIIRDDRRRSAAAGASAAAAGGSAAAGG